MRKKILKVSIVLIYVLYTFLLIWQTYYSNQTEIFTETNQYSEIISNKFEIILQRQTSTIVLLLFVILLYAHINLRQRGLAIVSSFFAASILILHDALFSLFAFALLVFGLVVAFFELKKNDDESIEN